MRLAERHRQIIRERGPLGRPTTDDRLDVLEEMVAEATGRTVEQVRDSARLRAQQRTAR